MVAENNNNTEENEELDDQQDLESALESLEEDDLESQVAATMVAESLEDSSDDEDLEAQMAAAMAAELGDEGEEDLEAQMAAALGEEESPLGDSLLDGLPDDLSGMEDEDISVKQVEFQQLRPSDETPRKDSVDRLMDVSLSLSVELGRKQMQIREILDLGPGKIIELDKLAGEPVDLLVNGKLLAKGEVVVVDENFGVRITDLISPKDRIKSL